MADLKNIALSVEAERVAKRIAEEFPVENQMDLARLGFAYAIRSGLSPDGTASPGTRTANYSSAGIDPGGRMAELVGVFFADDPVSAEPYRVVEQLMNKGLLLLEQHLEEGMIGSVSDLIPSGQQP